MTTLARDEEGARVAVPMHAHAIIANLAGDVVLAAGFPRAGAIRASGDVVLHEGSRVRFDGRLAREGRLDLPLPRATLAGLAFPTRGLPGRRGLRGTEPVAAPEASGPSAAAPSGASPVASRPDRSGPRPGQGQPPRRSAPETPGVPSPPPQMRASRR